MIPLYRHSFATPACHIGVIEAAQKAVFRRLIEEYNINEQDLNRIISPIGLEIKAEETPAEIAISITGQMIQVRADRRLHQNDGKISI